MSSLIPLGALALALSVSPISPLLLVSIPLGIMLVALRPTDLTGLLTGVALLALAFLSWESGSGPDWFVHRSWPVLLGSAFVAATLVLRGASLLSRSFAAVAMAGFAVLAAGLFRPTVVAGIDDWMAEQIQLAAVVLLQWSQTAAGSPEVADSVGEAILRWSEIQQQIYPALLALASLPALALGWFLMGRLTGRPEPLAPVREFRFNDHLVWLFVAGLALFILSSGGGLERVGANAAIFMAVLYVVRGGAVVGWLLTAADASIWSWLLLALATLLLYPVAVGAAFVFGIGDTWLDVRERFRGRRSSGSA